MSSFQLLVALHALSNIGVLHTDIKPDNVMFVNSQEQPLRIKLIDFGLAISRSRVNPGMDLQPTGYRYQCHDLRLQLRNLQLYGMFENVSACVTTALQMLAYCGVKVCHNIPITFQS